MLTRLPIALVLKHAGRDLIRHFPGRGQNNAAILITLANGAQNRVMGIEAGERENASTEQLEKAMEASADIVDGLTTSVRNKLGG